MDHLPPLESDDSDQYSETANLLSTEEIDYVCTELNINEYVVVKFETKKKVIHYISQLNSIRRWWNT